MGQRGREAQARGTISVLGALTRPRGPIWASWHSLVFQDSQKGTATPVGGPKRGGVGPKGSLRAPSSLTDQAMYSGGTHGDTGPAGE